jgi:transmembrane sensor
MSEDTRTILKKLMRDALDEKDRQRLLCDPKVEERMRSQWDEAADRVNPVVGNRMWERIIARTMATNGVRKLWVYKITAIAASILLLLGVGSVVYYSCSIYKYTPCFPSPYWVIKKFHLGIQEI